MEKYLVVVNQTTLISVWARSHGGAEQAIFQACTNCGISSCQAFSKNELTTDTFRHYLDRCNTMSLSEFSEMAHKVKIAEDKLKELNDRYQEAQKVRNDLDHHIESLAKEKLEIQQELTTQLQNMHCAGASDD